MLILAVSALVVFSLVIFYWWFPSVPASLPSSSVSTVPASLPSSSVPSVPASLPSSSVPTVPASLPSSSVPSLPTVPASLPSSSAPIPSSSVGQWKYDVFLSFRGIDTRKSITFELYDQLQNKRGINTFMDDQDLPVGGEISLTLVTAIEESKFAIVVLSKEYASSTWCLEELTKICQCMKDGNRILPVFYQVDPTDVRSQKNSFKEAFTRHENSGRHVPEKVQQWRDALNRVANFSGWHILNYKTDKELIETIVEGVCERVGPPEMIISGDFEKFAATRRAMEEVMKALKDDSVTAIGVHGMGGVGKTTMVKNVGAQACKNGMSDHMIMATVSQNPNISNIQGTLLAALLRSPKDVPELGRASRLNKEIKKRNQILIVLDDIWESIDLSSIGIPNKEELEKCKSKVLLTTRDRHVCHVMRCQEKICLDILSVDDSWTLFVRNAGRSFESTKFEEVARRVAGECGGLPIALITVAKALGDKDLEEWKKAARRLEKSQTANHPHDRGESFKCIYLSYDYLKHEDYKSYFLLCCLYPEDYDIPLVDLFKYAFGKGLFRDADTIEEARGTAVSVAKHLKSCSLLLDCGNEGYVRMHDVIRDTAIEIARSDGHGFFVKAGCGLKDWPPQLHGGDYSVVSLMWNNIRKLPEQRVCPKLQILLLPRNYYLDEIPETFFESRKDLRVLDLSNNRVSMLPQSFSLLTNLQALYLDFCWSMSIDTSLLGNLKKLEILSMRGYPNQKLSAEIGQLTNLRMLDISGGDVGGGTIIIPFKVISKLHRLEELYMLNCGFKDWGSIVEGEGEETSVGFEDLGSSVEGEGEETNIGFEDWGSSVEGEGEETSVCFEDSGSSVEGEGEETNIRLAELVGLSNLKILQVDIANAECIPEKVDAKPNWDYFVIRIGMPNVDDDHHNRLNHNSRYLYLEDTTIATLPDWFVNAVTEKTEELIYFECGGLSSIHKEFDHGRLNELKRLYVADAGYLVELMNSTTRVKTEPVFKNLEELHLRDLYSLEELCVGELPPESLSNLHLLDVRYCTGLKNVSKFLQKLPNLETLHLEGNAVIEYVFETTGFQPKQSKLRQMKLAFLGALRSICKGPIQHPMFPNLKLLVIWGCHSLRSILASDVAEHLSQLEDLLVQSCTKLECVIEARKEAAMNKTKSVQKKKKMNKKKSVQKKKIILPKLKSLVLRDLPELYTVSAIAIDLECPSLEHLYVKKCPLFSFYFPSPPQFQSKNQVQLNDEANYNRLERDLGFKEDY